MREQFQTSPKLLRRQETAPRPHAHIVPETVNVFGGCSGERDGSVALQAAATRRAIAVRQKQALLLERILVNFSGDAPTNLIIQKRPISVPLAVGQPFPERLPEAHK